MFRKIPYIRKAYCNLRNFIYRISLFLTVIFVYQHAVTGKQTLNLHYDDQRTQNCAFRQRVLAKSSTIAAMLSKPCAHRRGHTLLRSLHAARCQCYGEATIDSLESTIEHVNEIAGYNQ